MRHSPPSSEPSRVVVVGASAGGVSALSELVSGLPADWPGALFVVLHSAPEAPGRLPNVLGRVTPLEVAHAQDGEDIVAGRVYVAPPDRHLVLRRAHVHLSRGPRENGTRPAIDPLFRSAAAAHGAAAVGIVLTGTLDDGTAGLLAVEAAGGVTIVQDPEDADFPDMPRNALAYVRVQHVLPLPEIAPLLVGLAAAPVRAPSRSREPAGVTTAGGSGAAPPSAPPSDPTTPTIAGPGERASDAQTLASISCPECHGSLWGVSLGDLMEYRCHVGHRYSPESLLFHLGERRTLVVESALRTLDEEAVLAQELAWRAREADGGRALRYERRAEAARTRARALRDLLGTTSSS